MSGLVPESSDDQVDLVALRALATEIATRAAQFVSDERPAKLAFTSKRSEGDIVTEMDQRAQDLIISLIAEHRPQDAVLGEEQGGRFGTSGLTWVIDPIDGTTNYLYDQPAYAVSVAVVHGDPAIWGSWEPLVGAVAAPQLGSVYSAARGWGADVTRAGLTEPIAVSPATNLAIALAGTGFSHDAAMRSRQGRMLSHVLGEVRDIRRLGSAAVDLCLVAEGKLDCYFEHALNSWDMAAGWLIATEAGARVGGARGDGPDELLVWACGEGLTPQFPDLVRSAHRAEGII